MNIIEALQYMKKNPGKEVECKSTESLNITSLHTDSFGGLFLQVGDYNYQLDIELDELLGDWRVKYG